jgi:hypothetical protein
MVIGPFCQIQLLAFAAQALTYKAFVPVLLPQQLVLTELFSSLLVFEHSLFNF